MTLKAVLIANSGTHARSVRSDANENVVLLLPNRCLHTLFLSICGFTSAHADLHGRMSLRKVEETYKIAEVGHPA